MPSTIKSFSSSLTQNSCGTVRRTDAESTPLLYQKESYDIRGSIYSIYKTYRNYHKEIVYHNSLYNELIEKEYRVEKNKRISIFYKGNKVGTYVPDLVINDIIIVELKCKPRLVMEDRKQFWHYLKSTEYKLGFLVNFGSPHGVEIERKVFDQARTPSA